MVGKVKQIVDLSLPLENFNYTGFPAEITYWDHEEGARQLAKPLGLPQDAFEGGIALAWEGVNLITHTATHLDAPWHFAPTSEGKPSKTIDQIPLEWCYSDGVRLDLRHLGRGHVITVPDIEAALNKINYAVKPWDIVLLWTGADKYYHHPDYTEIHPGMGEEATLYLVDKGVKIIGTDAYGYDIGFKEMAKLQNAGVKNALWPGHFASRKKEYLHIEAMANLDKIPVDHGFEVACFPVKVARGSAGWCRAVAIVRE